MRYRQLVSAACKEETWQAAASFLSVTTPTQASLSHLLALAGASPWDALSPPRYYYDSPEPRPRLRAAASTRPPHSWCSSEHGANSVTFFFLRSIQSTRL